MASDPSPHPVSESSYEPIRFLEEFVGNSVRGTALAAVAELDAQIGACLEKMTTGDPNTRGQIFGESGQLGSFGPRIRFIYLFGMIGKKTYDELGIINRIRNEFAHKADAYDYTQARIQGLVNNLAIYKDPIFPFEYISYAQKSDGFLPTKDGSAALWRQRVEHMGYDLKDPKFAFIVEFWFSP